LFVFRLRLSTYNIYIIQNSSFFFLFELNYFNIINETGTREKICYMFMIFRPRKVDLPIGLDKKGKKKNPSEIIVIFNF
jgi:hypothetical protein